MTGTRVLLAAAAAGLILSTGGVGIGTARDGQCGGASWYAMAGSRTASGAIMDPNAMTAAHRDLPFGSHIRVINQTNGREVTVLINDRGPFIRSRIIDVSRAAAEQLGFRRAGRAQVCLSTL